MLLGYEGKKVLKVQAEGNEIEDLVEQLNEDELQYSLVRVRYTKDSSEGPTVHLMRDVFVQWIGMSRHVDRVKMAVGARDCCIC